MAYTHIPVYVYTPLYKGIYKERIYVYTFSDLYLQLHGRLFHFCTICGLGFLIWARVDRSPYPTTLEIGVSEELRRLIAKANQVESLKS